MNKDFEMNLEKFFDNRFFWKKSNKFKFLQNNTFTKAENNENHNEEEEEIIPRDSSAFSDYITSAGNIIILFLVCLILSLSQTACSGADYWISYW